MRHLSREVRHIIRQNGSLIEEVIAVRSGRLVKYVKKDSRGVVTYGSYRLAARQSTEKKAELTETGSTRVKDKEGLLDAIMKVLTSQKKKE